MRHFVLLIFAAILMPAGLNVYMATAREDCRIAGEADGKTLPVDGFTANECNADTTPADGMCQKEARAEVLFETTEGNIRIALYDETPLHRDNFIHLVDARFYDSLLFHRVIRRFMIQAGDPGSRHARSGQELGDSSVGYTLPAEIRLPELYHRRGAVAMAREGDDVNPERRSGGSQFYIVWGKRFSTADIDYMQHWLDTVSRGSIIMTPGMKAVYRKTGGAPHLDGTYTVFGEVVEGLDVVERIQGADTDDNDRPVYDVRILRATVVKRKLRNTGMTTGK